MSSRFFRTALILLAALAPLARADDDTGIKINKPEANVKVQAFDPAHPPKEMPPLRKDEAAVTESAFACAVQLEVESKIVGDGAIKTKIVALRMDLRLDVTEWVPRNASRKIRAHEDGHRAISEHFYQSAEKIAQDIARTYVGKNLDVKSKDGIQAAIKKAATELCQEYLGAVEKPSQLAQEKYDEITDHGRNRVSEKRAIEQSIQAVTKQSPAPTSQASR